MSRALTPRDLLIWIGTVDDIDAPVLIEDGKGFTTVTAHGTLGTPDLGLTFRRRLPLLVTPDGITGDRNWRTRRATVYPLLKRLDELT